MTYFDRLKLLQQSFSHQKMLLVPRVAVPQTSFKQLQGKGRLKDNFSFCKKNFSFQGLTSQGWRFRIDSQTETRLSDLSQTIRPRNERVRLKTWRVSLMFFNVQDKAKFWNEKFQKFSKIFENFPTLSKISKTFQVIGKFYFWIGKN